MMIEFGHYDSNDYRIVMDFGPDLGCSSTCLTSDERPD